MEVVTKAKYLHISPRKIRLVADLIRGIDVVEAEKQLRFIPQKGGKLLLKILNSAVANAEHNFNMVKENLFISKILVDQGSTFKRWRPRAFGRPALIRKRTSHVTLILDERIKGKKRKKIKEEAKEVKEIEKKEIKDKRQKTVEPKRPPAREEKKGIFKGKINQIKKQFFQRKSIG